MKYGLECTYYNTKPTIKSAHLSKLKMKTFNQHDTTKNSGQHCTIRRRFQGQKNAMHSKKLKGRHKPLLSGPGERSTRVTEAASNRRCYEAV